MATERMDTDKLRKFWNLVLVWCGMPKVGTEPCNVLDALARELERARLEEERLLKKNEEQVETINLLVEALEAAKASMARKDFERPALVDTALHRAGKP